MNSYRITILTFISLVLLNAPVVSSESLQKDYAVLVERRKGLERQASELSQTLSKLEDERRALEERWGICANARWRFVWEPAVKKAEENRQLLETQRSRLFQLNTRLNNNNFKIEQKRRIIEHKHPVKNFEYELEFREYMHLCENDYLLPLENEYFFGFKEYLSGVRKYCSFVEYSISACNNNDIAPVAIEQGFKHAEEIFVFIKNINDILKGKKTVQ